MDRPRLSGLRLAARAALLAAALLAGPAGGQAGGTVARVNGAAIDRERVERRLEENLAERGRSLGSLRSPAAYRQLRREALDQLVGEELLWQEAVRRGHRLAAGEVERAVAREREQAGSDEALRARLSRRGIDEAGLRERLAREGAVARYLDRELLQGLTVTDAEARAFYAANPERFTPEGQEAVPEARVHERLKEYLLRERREEAVRARVEALRTSARVEILAPP